MVKVCVPVRWWGGGQRARAVMSTMAAKPSERVLSSELSAVLGGKLGAVSSALRGICGTNKRVLGLNGPRDSIIDICGHHNRCFLRPFPSVLTTAW